MKIYVKHAIYLATVMIDKLKQSANNLHQYRKMNFYIQCVSKKPDCYN